MSERPPPLPDATPAAHPGAPGRAAAGDARPTHSATAQPAANRAAFDPAPDPPPPPPGSQWSDAVDAGSPRNRRFWLWVLLAGGGCFVVVLTTGLLVLTYLPRLVERLSSGSRFAVESDLRRITEALEAYPARHSGRHAEALEELARPDADGHVLLESLPLDPWGRAYRYAKPSPEHARPRVWTLGADDRPGGAGADTDITSDELGRRR